MNFHNVFISIGSNIGDRALNCKKAIEEVKNLKNTKLTKISCLYETKPLEYSKQNYFINCAIEIKTEKEPLKLLESLKEIEKKFGRTNIVRYRPRIIDLDIIFFDNIIISSKKLEIPHPKAHKRAFVLKPICDIDKKIVHPILKQNIYDILSQLKGQKIIKCQEDS